jgi:hypothetical protein
VVAVRTFRGGADFDSSLSSGFCGCGPQTGCGKSSDGKKSEFTHNSFLLLKVLPGNPEIAYNPSDCMITRSLQRLTVKAAKELAATSFETECFPAC